jgi:hypothetical protein
VSAPIHVNALNDDSVESDGGGDGNGGGDVDDNDDCDDDVGGGGRDCDTIVTVVGRGMCTLLFRAADDDKGEKTCML